MQSLKYPIILLFGIFRIICAQNANLYTSCTIERSNEKGFCRGLSECPSLVNDARNSKFPTFCGTRRGIPLFCCPSREGAGRSGFSESDLPPRGVCGRVELSDYVVGGELTSIHEHPWYALLGFRTGYSNALNYGCGGTLINERYVLTAEHCLFDAQHRPNRPISVRLGEHNLNTQRDCDQNVCADPVVEVPIEEHIPHENYRRSRDPDDIALLRLARSITFTEWISPICLPILNRPRSSNFETPDKLTLVGFGRTETGRSSPVKLKLELNVTPMSYCERHYAGTFNTSLDPEKQICAGGEYKKDSCNGDSGSGLMGVDTSDPSKFAWYIAGIVSFGPRECGTENTPGVYSRVNYHIDWILQNMRR